MVDRDYILAPGIVETSFELQALMIQTHSLELLNVVDQLSGLDNWVTETFTRMPDALRRDNMLFTQTGWVITSGRLMPPLPAENLPEYLDRLMTLEPEALMSAAQNMWIRWVEENPHHYPEVDFSRLHTIFTDRDSFVDHMVRSCYVSPPHDLWEEAYALMQQPSSYMTRLGHYVHTMWDEYLGEEWMRQLPLLTESIQAFQRLDLRDLTLYDAIRVVAGRDMRGKLEAYEAHIRHVVFIPSPHLGPYVGKIPNGDKLLLLYGARLPHGMASQDSPFSRSELLIRMNALADDTRLRILEMLAKREEMCAQDIIEALNLSQSTVSRHLSQLSATGFLLERRRDVNKCYSLNVDRVVDTARALTHFLARQ